VAANKLRWLLGLLLLMAATCPCLASERALQLTGTFSSFEFHRESGDLNGIEVRLIRVRNGIKGVIQLAEGGAGDVMLVDVSTNGSKVSFSTSASSPVALKFEGEVQVKGLSGIASIGAGVAEKVFLKRQQSYWDR